MSEKNYSVIIDSLQKFNNVVGNLNNGEYRCEKYNEIYGVTLKQFWNTTNYSDVGYIFLMIEFKDDENLIIHVRTWQPEKVGTHTIAKDDVFSLGKFGNYNR